MAPNTTRCDRCAAQAQRLSSPERLASPVPAPVVSPLMAGYAMRASRVISIRTLSPGVGCAARGVAALLALAPGLRRHAARAQRVGPRRCTLRAAQMLRRAAKAAEQKGAAAQHARRRRRRVWHADPLQPDSGASHDGQGLTRESARGGRDVTQARRACICLFWSPWPRAARHVRVGAASRRSQ